jgi:hypothetical protein
MATMFRITQHVFENGMTLSGEPFAVVMDEDSDFLVFCATPVEVSADPSKATEVIGNVPTPNEVLSK